MKINHLRRRVVSSLFEQKNEHFSNEKITELNTKYNLNKRNSQDKQTKMKTNYMNI